MEPVMSFSKNTLPARVGRSPTFCSFLSSIWLAVACLILAPNANAHYCGPPVIRCKPGDIVTYYIVADVNEDQISLYDVIAQTEPTVAPVVFFTPASPFFGQFVFEAREVGTNKVDLFWSFPPNMAADVCVVDIRVTTNEPPVTAGSNPFAVLFGDPVNAFTGEYIVQEPPDLMLGGPTRLHFSRYYASRLQNSGLIRSSLGNNWSHNFEWHSIVLTNRAVIVAPDGFNVHFDRSGTNWALNHPTNLNYQLVDQPNGVIFGDPRDNHLYAFNTNGLPTSISDGRGNVQTLTYTNDLQLTQVSDGLGRTLTFNYVEAQLLSSVSDGTRTIGFNHQFFFPGFNLAAVTNALGEVTTYTYNNFIGDGALLTGTTYPEGNASTAQTYDSLGRVVTQSRLGTNITRFHYDTATLTTTVTNALGNVSVYTHSADGHLVSLTDEGGESLNVTKNGLGLRGSITSRDGDTVGFAYDPVSRTPTSFTNVDGTVTHFTYTNRTVSGMVFYDLASVTMPDGTTEAFVYDTAGNVLSHTDRAGNLTRWSHNARGQWLSITNSAGGVASFTYNADGTVATRTDADTGTTSLFYDSLRRPTNAVASDGCSLGVTFDAGDRVTSATDERTNTTYFTYDGNDRLVAVTNAAGQVTQFGYDAADRLINLEDPLGNSSSLAYDGLNQAVSFTNRNGNAASFAWDSRQRLTGITDPGSQTWTLGYNNEGQPVRNTSPLGESISRALDAAGFVTAHTNAADQTVTLGRDVMHRLVSRLDPLGRLDLYGYDSRGWLTNTTFSAVGTAGYESDSIGRLARITDQVASEWSFGFSELGRLVELVDPLGRTNSVGLDTRGRPQLVTYPDSSTVTNTYDAAGNLTGMAYSDGSAYSFTYDGLNRVTAVPGLALSYDAVGRITNTISSGVDFGASYDIGGRLATVSYNNGALTVTYVYDSRDRLTQVTDSLTAAQLDFYYGDSGRLTNVVRANGINGLYDYDPVGRVTRIREGGFLDLQYSLNAAGEITALDSTAPLSAAPSAAATNQFTFDVAHQISSAGYTYDTRGRLTGSPGHTFTWDAASQLTRIDGVTNTYNGAGNILTRADASSTMRYHYNHALGLAPIVAEQDAGSSQFQRYYVWSPAGELLYMIDASSGNAVSYFHFDQTGSTLALTSGAGAVTDAYAYSPFGVLMNQSGSNPQPFRYVGRFGVRTEPVAGLCHMRARYYDPVAGRFLLRDPVWPRLKDPLSLNPYQYAANNPLLYIDPLGLLDREALLVALESKITSVQRTLSRQLGINFPPISGMLKPDQAGVMGVIIPLIVILQQFNLIDPEEIYWRQYWKRYQQENLYRYNQLTLMLKTHPISMIRLLQVSRSYDPAGSVLADSIDNPRLLTMPGANLYATAELASIGNLQARLAEERQAVKRYAQLVRQPHIGFLANNYFSPMLQVINFGGVYFPPVQIPRGVAFVNGQLVTPKMMDLIHESIERKKVYDYLWEYDIWPEDLTNDLLSRLGVGGSSFCPDCGNEFGGY